METFKGIVRALIAFALASVTLAVVFACLMTLLPLMIGFTAFDADGARRSLECTPKGDPISETGDWVLRFVLRLMPDCPAEAKEPPR